MGVQGGIGESMGKDRARVREAEMRGLTVSLLLLQCGIWCGVYRVHCRNGGDGEACRRTWSAASPCVRGIQLLLLGPGAKVERNFV